MGYETIVQVYLCKLPLHLSTLRYKRLFLELVRNFRFKSVVRYLDFSAREGHALDWHSFARILSLGCHVFCVWSEFWILLVSEAAGCVTKAGCFCVYLTNLSDQLCVHGNRGGCMRCVPLVLCFDGDFLFLNSFHTVGKFCIATEIAFYHQDIKR